MSTPLLQIDGWGWFLRHFIRTTCFANMKSVVYAGVVSGVSWEDAKEGRCALEEQVKGGSTVVYLPWYSKLPTTAQRSVTGPLTASECCSCKPWGAVVKGCIQLQVRERKERLSKEYGRLNSLGCFPSPCSCSTSGYLPGLNSFFIRHCWL